MTDNHTSLEPLADYLEPQFGNIYDWDNSVVPYDTDSFDSQPWTDGVRQAIRHYLLHEAPQELAAIAFPRSENTSVEQWADNVLEHHQPWEVAFEFHKAAVASLLTLDALIGHLDTWLYEDDRDDAAEWLEKHCTGLQLEQIATVSKNAALAQLSHRGNLACALVHQLEPPVLVKLWRDITGSSPSDLTDAEWELIKPFMPFLQYYDTARAAINGMLFWSREGCHWGDVPARYGTWTAIYQRYLNYRRKGVFTRMLEALQGNLEAARLVDWLRQHAH
jgi:transposase